MANIETLLDLSQMQVRKLNLNPCLFSISKEMEKISYNFTSIAQNKGVRVFSFIDPKLPNELDADFKKIIQVMNSLIQNAIKFTPRGGRIVVEVKLLKRQLNGNCSISFSVKDNGKGIANEKIPLITKPFVAGSQADERLGIGLSLSYGLVSLLGSELKIQSEEGYGSYFNFTLDFKDAVGQAYKMMPKKRVKVLLLEPSRVDEANFLTIYLRAFAMDVVKSNILDANVYNGIDTLYVIANQEDSSWMLKLRTYFKKVPVILVIDENEKLLPKLTYIVDDVITKPFLPSLVEKQLNKIYNKTLLTTVELSSLSILFVVFPNLFVLVVQQIQVFRSLVF
jgi:hypothetical protein